MAVTVTTDHSQPGEATITGVVTFDNSYSAGGEAVTAAQFGLSNIDAIVVVGTRANTTFEVYYSPPVSKLWVVVSATGVEVAAAVDLSALVVDVLVFGN